MNKLVTLADLNTFTITEIVSRGEVSTLSGRLSLPGQPSRGDLVNLFRGLNVEDVDGELVGLDPDAGTATIETSYSPLPASLKGGSSFPVYYTYWSGKLRLVLDPAITWTRTTFASPDAFATEMPNGWRQWRQAEPGDEARTDGKIVPHGWDHEHCEICWTHIDADHPDAWMSNDDRWVCPSCYARYVGPGDLRFVTDGLEDDSPAGPTAEEEAFSAVCRLIDTYDLAAIRAWLDAGNKVDVRSWSGWTPLMVAASRGQQTLVDLLLSAGADASAVAEQHGYTPLALAAQKGYVEVTRALLVAGASVVVPSTLCGGSLITYVKTGRGRDSAEIAEMLSNAGAT